MHQRTNKRFGLHSSNLFLVNGGYSEWSSWSQCSSSCGVGHRSRSRTCTNPHPGPGGNDCSGSNTNTEQCNIADCPGKHHCHASLVSSSVFMNANHRRFLKQGHWFSKLIQKYHVTKVDYFIIFGVYFRSRDFIKYRYIYWNQNYSYFLIASSA